MEQSYAEATVKIKTTIGTVLARIGSIILIALLLVLGWLGVKLVMVIGVAGAAFLIWYWPRFRSEWEYVFCDGQLDFDMIKGGEKRKNVMRIDIENADVIAPIGSTPLDGYRHLPVKDCSSKNEGAKLYGIATRLPKQEKKVLIQFEPSEKMIEMMKAKCPNIVKTEE